MGCEIKRLWARPGRFAPGGNSRRYIVVHNTASTATAREEALNLANNPGKSSFHYVLDGSEVYQCVHDYDTAWAVGAWLGARQLIGNDQSVSIEVCSPGAEFTEAEVGQLRFVVADLMAAYGIPPENVVRHYDCHTGRKRCPAAYVDEAKWKELHARITGGGEGEEDMTPEQAEKLDVIYRELTRTDASGWDNADGHTMFGRINRIEHQLYRTDAEGHEVARGHDVLGIGGLVLECVRDIKGMLAEALAKRA